MSWKDPWIKMRSCFQLKVCVLLSETVASLATKYVHPFFYFWDGLIGHAKASGTYFYLPICRRDPTPMLEKFLVKQTKLCHPSKLWVKQTKHFHASMSRRTRLRFHLKHLCFCRKCGFPGNQIPTTFLVSRPCCLLTSR